FDTANRIRMSANSARTIHQTNFMPWAFASGPGIYRHHSPRAREPKASDARWPWPPRSRGRRSSNHYGASEADSNRPLMVQTIAQLLAGLEERDVVFADRDA